MIKKQYPKRFQLGDKIYSEILSSIRQELRRESIVFNIDKAAASATEQIIKIVQNNYRRRRRGNNKHRQHKKVL